MFTKLAYLMTAMTLTLMALHKRQSRIEEERWMQLRLSRSLHGHVRSNRARLFG